MVQSTHTINAATATAVGQPIEESKILTVDDVMNLIEDSINKQLADIRNSLRDITEIKNVLLGDGRYYKEGLKQQHDELWSNYVRLVNNRTFERMEEIINVYQSIKTSLRIFGVTSVLALVVSTLNILKLFNLI